MTRELAKAELGIWSFSRKKVARPDMVNIIGDWKQFAIVLKDPEKLKLPSLSAKIRVFLDKSETGADERQQLQIKSDSGQAEHQHD